MLNRDRKLELCDDFVFVSLILDAADIQRFGCLDMLGDISRGTVAEPGH